MKQSQTDIAEGGMLSGGHLLRSRRSISRFLPKPVDRVLIEKAVDAARWAPNHLLTEPWHFYLLGPEAVKATVDMARIIGTERRDEELGERKARRAEKVPAWVVVTYARSDEDPVLDRENYAATCCAIHNFSLDLWESGVGMKWCTGPIVDDTRYYDRLGIELSSEYIVGILRIGYAQTVPTQKRKSVDQILTVTE